MNIDKEILKNVYELAKIRHTDSLNKKDDRTLLEKIEAGDYNRSEESELYKYLESLTYDQNLMILAIAYIGRGDLDEDFEQNKDIEKIYNFMLNYVRRTFQEKSFVVNQIHQKLPLDNYLKRGFELLKIEL